MFVVIIKQCPLMVKTKNRRHSRNPVHIIVRPEMAEKKNKTPVVLNRMQFLIGLLLLALGCLIYVTERVPADVYFTRFFGLNLKLSAPDTQILGSLGDRLPAFIHVFAFSMMSAALIAATHKRMFAVCTGWFLINFVFEMGQKYKAAAAGLVPDIFRFLPFFENTRSYFLSGTFDWLDILAAAAGAGAAYLTWLATKKYHSPASS